MGIFLKFFGKVKNESKRQNFIDKITNEECRRLLGLKGLIESLLESKHYVARSEYRSIIAEYEDIIEYFTVLKNSGMLSSFCEKNGIDKLIVEEVIYQYLNINQLVDDANEKFVCLQMETDKLYLDNVLKEVDSNIVLDMDQRRVILTDEDYCLVIAGAGAGKTTTVAAKVKYLVDKKNIDPKQILVVSFTNKAVKELKEKIQDSLGIECPIATFHSTGNAIIHKNSPNEKLNIVESYKLYFVIRDYFRGSILKNESIVNKLIMFLHLILMHHMRVKI